MASSFLSPTFLIGHIKIGTVEGASCINMGNNYPTNFESHKKHNQGFGTVGGDSNQVHHAKSALNDSDFIDMISETNKEIPEWIKALITDNTDVSEINKNEMIGEDNIP